MEGEREQIRMHTHGISGGTRFRSRTISSAMLLMLVMIVMFIVSLSFSLTISEVVVDGIPPALAPERDRTGISSPPPPRAEDKAVKAAENIYRLFYALQWRENTINENERELKQDLLLLPRLLHETRLQYRENRLYWNES